MLDISAVLVILGVSLAIWRRGRDRGALAVQQFGADLIPLVMIFAVSITGVFPTVSTHLMRGLHFVFLPQLHAVTVIFTLLCSNCVLACPFGVPKYDGDADQMMKCDTCYDRTSTGRRPMCATVCLSGALAFSTIEEIMRTRQGRAVNDWQFGDQHVRTKVFVLVPTAIASAVPLTLSAGLLWSVVSFDARLRHGGARG